jgi:hypothetical protein
MGANDCPGEIDTEAVGKVSEEPSNTGDSTSVDNQVRSRVTAALSADVPKLYANAFAIVMGTADSMVVLEQNGKPIAVLNLSFTSAKTLAVKLGNVISNLEENSGRSIMTTDDIEGLFSPGRQS